MLSRGGIVRWRRGGMVVPAVDGVFDHDEMVDARREARQWGEGAWRGMLGHGSGCEGGGKGPVGCAWLRG